jgi:hypothetical protein
MVDTPGKYPLWEVIRKYYLLPVILIWFGGLAAILIINKVDPPLDVQQEIQGQWDWNDSTIFEFQRISLRFDSDSFFMSQRFIDPRNPGHKLPCSQSDYQTYVSGRITLLADTVLDFEGNYTDFLFSRDTLRLCRDTGFRARTHLEWKQDTLCLRGEAFARLICFVRARAKEQ